MAHNEVYLRCAQLANASRVLGNLGDDILSKITLKSGVGTIVETGLDDGHFMALRGPVTLRHMRFRLTDLDGNVVRLGAETVPELVTSPQTTLPVDTPPLVAVKVQSRLSQSSGPARRRPWTRRPPW